MAPRPLPLQSWSKHLSVRLYLAAILCFARAEAGTPLGEPLRQTSEIRIAAASDLKFVMQELIQEYKDQEPHLKITAIFGSSGSFVSQMEQGARFDLFFSADSFYPKKLSQSPHVGGETFEYAVGHLVLWIPSDSELTIESGLSLLTSPNVKKVALANPAHAPYGKAAETALKNAKIYDLISKKLVLGENVSQATQFIQTHAADVGIIAQSLALSPTLKNKGHLLPVPQTLYPEIVQSGLLLKSSSHPKEAQSFRNWILGDQGKKIFVKWGFSLK